MAHPSREKHFEYLREKLGNVPFLIDEESKGTAFNSERSWRAYNKYCDYHVVIQDDAIICKDFISKAEDLIERVNTEKIKIPEVANSKYIAFNFYYGLRKSFEEEAKIAIKRGYIVKKNVHWGVAICLPTAIIDEMLDFFNKQTAPQDDERITRFLRSKNIPVYFPIPSLIDHRHEEKSLVGDLGTKRKAYKFIDNEN
jgi:hypothetical protein